MKYSTHSGYRVFISEPAGTPLSRTSLQKVSLSNTAACLLISALLMGGMAFIFASRVFSLSNGILSTSFLASSVPSRCPSFLPTSCPCLKPMSYSDPRPLTPIPVPKAPRDPGGVEPGGVEPGGVDPGGVEPGGVEPGGAPVPPGPNVPSGFWIPGPITVAGSAGPGIGNIDAPS